MKEQLRSVNRHSVDQLADVREQIKQLKKDEAAIVAEVSKAMEDADNLGGEEWIATQAMHARKGSLDIEAMKAAGIDVEKYRKPGSTVFQIRLERRESTDGRAA